jgi:hypothetical protein
MLLLDLGLRYMPSAGMSLSHTIARVKFILQLCKLCKLMPCHSDSAQHL